MHARGGGAIVARDAPSLPAGFVGHVFVFSPTGAYGPDPAPNVGEIDAADLIDFIRSERWRLPLSVSEWMERVSD